MGKTVNFQPVDNQRSEEEWVTLGKGTFQLPAHHERAEQVLSDNNSYDINKLPLRDPDAFVLGGVHNHVDEWRKILSSGVKDKEVLSYIEQGVDVKSFLSILKVISKANHTILTCHRDSIFQIQVVAKNLLHLLQQSY